MSLSRQRVVIHHSAFFLHSILEPEQQVVAASYGGGSPDMSKYTYLVLLQIARV